MPRAYYNEIDPFAAQWIRNLIAAGHVMAGDVDERSIVDVRPDDLVGYDRCHFFAGIAVWDYALGLAGWLPGHQVWTGSCPCQPFSAAGKGGGISDERHLWPALFHLIEQCRPAAVFGEQVASKDGLDWLDLVHADLEGAHYDVGATDLCAAGVGAPHIRQRLWFVAYAQRERVRGQGSGAPGTAARRVPAEDRQRQRLRSVSGAGGGSLAGPMADVLGTGLEGGDARALGDECAASERGGAAGGLVDADGWHTGAEGLQRGWQYGQRSEDSLPVRGRDRRLGHNGGPELERSGEADGFWTKADWISCRDGRWRPVEPGTFPLAHAIAGRVGRLRAYGNAINAEAAAAFISACLDVLP